jgi:hypothetical protein
VLVPNKWHQSLQEGTVEEDKFVSLFLDTNVENNGFQLRVEGLSDDFAMDFKWSDMVNHPVDLMIFGKRKRKLRSFQNRFRKKSNPWYLQHVYRQFAEETRGDVNAASRLTMAYLERKNEVANDDVKKIETVTKKDIINNMSFV